MQLAYLGLFSVTKASMPEESKDRHIGFCGINSLTDWFGDINKFIKNKLQII